MTGQIFLGSSTVLIWCLVGLALIDECFFGPIRSTFHVYVMTNPADVMAAYSVILREFFTG